MNDLEQKRFDRLYQRHVLVLKLRGYAASTIDAYARAVRRLVAYFDGVPDRLSVEQLETYFANLVDSVTDHPKGATGNAGEHNKPSRSCSVSAG